MSKFTISINGIVREVEVTRKSDVIHLHAAEGQPFELRLVEQKGAAFILELSSSAHQRKLIRAAGFLQGDKRQLWVNGRTFTYQRVRQRKTTDNLDASLSSSIPAVVSQVLVGVGDTVAEGDRLILLESMKMVIPITASAAAKVTAVHCAKGDSVPAGVPLISLEEIEI